MREIDYGVLALGTPRTIREHLIECGWTPPAEDLAGRRIMYGCKMGTVRQLWSDNNPVFRVELDSGQTLFLTRGSFELLP